jgi:(1->4)-alpha-D-glucan 1-alpha-D-glucosylmutase
VFYRYNRLVALNEVGGEPDHFGAPLDVFHDAMALRMVRQPAGLSATGTHDTKRGEDARARLMTLSEAPFEWAENVARWSALNAHLATSEGENSYPDRETEWLFYQALLGAWSMSAESAEGAVFSRLADRMAEFMSKAVREAKALTSWTAPDEAYEAAIERFTRGALDPDRSGSFLADFGAASQPLLLAGALNGLAQTLIKLVAPGVPDIYQGAETWELSLVDPDNRRRVDFDRLASQLDEAATASPAALLAAWRSGLPKLHLIARGLALRSACPRLFAEGAYIPLSLSGPRARHGVAFARIHEGAAAIAVLPRLPHALLGGGEVPLIPAEQWRGTSVALPQALTTGRDWQDCLAGEVVASDGRIDLETALASFPVALFSTSPI